MSLLYFYQKKILQMETCYKIAFFQPHLPTINLSFFLVLGKFHTSLNLPESTPIQKISLYREAWCSRMKRCPFPSQEIRSFFELVLALITSTRIGRRETPIIPKMTVSKCFFTIGMFPKK